MRFLAPLLPGTTVITAADFGPIVRGQLGMVTGRIRGSWSTWQPNRYVCTFLGGTKCDGDALANHGARSRL